MGNRSRLKIDEIDPGTQAKRQNFSKRAAKDHKISVINKRCYKCNHHKIWSKPSGRFCCKCGTKYEDNK